MGGQKSRWNDLAIVQRDLRQCGLEDSWRVAAQNRNGWRSVESRIEDCNSWLRMRRSAVKKNRRGNYNMRTAR